MESIENRRLAWTAAAIALALLAVRILAASARAALPPLFYSDSTSHILMGWWSAAGAIQPVSRYFPEPQGWLYLAAARFGVGLPCAVFAVNSVLAVAVVFATADAVRRLAGGAAAAIAALLVVCLPGFSKLLLSGQPEFLLIVCWSAALWLMSAPSGGPRAGVDALALAFAAAGAWLRPEGALFFVLLAAWFFRGRSLGSRVALAAWVLGCLYFFLPVHVVGLYSRMTGNSSAADLGVIARLARAPVWLLTTNAVFTLGWAVGLSGLDRARHRVLRGWAAVSLLHAAALCAVSGMYLFSWETERNFSPAFFLAAAPAAAGFAALIEADSRRKRTIAWLAFGAIVVFSWFRATRDELVVPAPVREARAAGWALKKVSRPDGVVVVEAADRDWPNIVVYADVAPDARLIPTVDPEWGAPRVWRGEGPVSAAVVRTAAAEKSVLEKTPGLKLAAQSGTWKIYAVQDGAAPAGPPPSLGEE